MREKILDPFNQPNNAAERRLGVTPQRDQNRAQERAQRYQENKGLAIVDDEGRVIGDGVRKLAITGAGATVDVLGDVATVDISAGGGGGAPTTATYITQTADAGLSAEQALSSLATGIVKNTTGTGVLSIAVAGTDYATNLTELSDTGTISPGTAGKVLAWDGATWDDSWSYTESLGPWRQNDIPGTATTAMKLLYFNTATAVSQSANAMRAGRTGWIVGARIVSDAARTAGTATVKILLNGADTAFDAGSVVLDGTRTTQDATIVAGSSGIQITSGADTIGVNIVTSGWTPTTANVQVQLLVIWDPIG